MEDVMEILLQASLAIILAFMIRQGWKNVLKKPRCDENRSFWGAGFWLFSLIALIISVFFYQLYSTWILLLIIPAASGLFMNAFEEMVGTKQNSEVITTEIQN